ncbi:MAG: hypothetical protein BGO26_13280 [Actinobacteria bacterium 69-20]|nr:carbohydrate ABC transporter permease [Actinomycetota bacterium]OJV23689.1 MAG: hypothetical protein BGO26_13280 [Actinobacteria bacterium 69-20]
MVQRVARAVIWAWVVINVFFMIWVVVASLKESSDIFSRTEVFALPIHPQWQNYSDAWVNSEIGLAMLNTVIVVGISSVLVVAISAPAAYALARFPNRSASALSGLFAIGMGIPLPAIVLPLYIAYVQVGLINTLVGLGILYVATEIPFTVFLLTGYFRSLPFELEEAAAMDGSSIMRTLRDIMLPLAKPGILTALILNVVFLWNETALVLYFIQDDTKFTLGRALLNLGTSATYTSAWGSMMAGSVIVVAPVIVLYIILGKQVVEGLTLGSGK